MKLALIILGCIVGLIVVAIGGIIHQWNKPNGYNG